MTDITQPTDEKPNTGLLTREEVDALAPEDFPPGTAGWVELDENGAPVSGSGTVEPPPVGTPAIRVITAVEVVPDSVTTPTGAPIMGAMNPCSVGLMDEGFLERNPPADVVNPVTKNDVTKDPKPSHSV